MPGKLIVGGVDIGNTADIPKRVLDYFDTADLVVCEWESDFLEKCRSVNKYPKNGYIEFVGQKPGNDNKIEYVTGLIESNKTVLLIVSDGMPVICDPGYDIINAARKKQLPITVIPGPSIVTTALSVSGFLSEKFIFEGDIPENKEERINTFIQYKNSPMTLVFLAIRHHEAKMFENGNKDNQFLMNTLIDMAICLGANRQITMCFNITGPNEFIFMGTIQEAIDWHNNNNVDGMLTIVVEGNYT